MDSNDNGNQPKIEMKSLVAAEYRAMSISEKNLNVYGKFAIVQIQLFVIFKPFKCLHVNRDEKTRIMWKLWKFMYNLF